MQAKTLDFIVIGAPKSGTTALFRYLLSHPSIYMPTAKEVPFFSDDQRFALGWDAFMNDFFKDAPLNKLCGKITPQYMEDSRVPKRMHQHLPDVKLVALLRNPVDRAFSHYRFLARRGVEPQPFEEVAFDPSAKKHNAYIPTGEYGRILKSYLDHFPSNRLLVLFHDDLESRPQFVLDSLLTYLGLPAGFSPANLGKRYNVGGTETRFSGLVSLARGSPLKRIWRLLPDRLRLGIGKWYFFEVAPVAEAAPELPVEVRKKLVDYYRSDVLQLETILGHPVPWNEFHP